MQTELRIAHDRPLSDALADALAKMLDEARSQARRAVESPGPALHDYRRTIRRAQALVALTAPTCRKHQRELIEDGLAHATRRTRTLRDLDAVLPVLTKLEAQAAEGDEAQALAALRRYLEAAGEELAGSEICAWRLRKNVRSIAGLAEIFGAGLHGWVELDMLRETLRDQYRATRDAWRRACRTEKKGDLHLWRKRARTLRYQLEALSSRVPEDESLANLYAAFTAQTKALGQITDLLALISIVEDADPELLGTNAERLAKWLDSLADARAATAMVEAEELFAVKPKSFAWPVEPAAEPTPEAPSDGPLTAVPDELVQQTDD